MDIPQAQIEKEFKRQARLCSGIGKRRMVEIILSLPRSMADPQGGGLVEDVAAGAFYAVFGDERTNLLGWTGADARARLAAGEDVSWWKRPAE